MPEQSFDALYYPYIHFWDVGWLKSTALYWDSISRIVPDGFEPEDPNEVRQLIDAGFVNDDHKERRPDQQAVVLATEAIRRLLDNHRRKLRARYGLQNRTSWTATDPNVSSLRRVQEGLKLDPRLGYIHQEKFALPFGEELVEAELAERVTGIGGGWYGVHPKLEEAYLWALASETARAHGLRLLADNPRHHTAIMGDLKDALRDFLLGHDQLSAAPAGRSPNLDAIMMTVVLRNVRPRDYNDLSASEIVALRHNTEEARGALQDRLQNLVFDREYLQNIRDMDALERRLSDLYARKLKPSLNQMERATQATRHPVDWRGASAVSFQIPPNLMAGLDHPRAWPLLIVCAAGALVVALWPGRAGPTNPQDPIAFYLHQIADMGGTAVAEAVATSAVS